MFQLYHYYSISESFSVYWASLIGGLRGTNGLRFTSLSAHSRPFQHGLPSQQPTSRLHKYRIFFFQRRRESDWHEQGISCQSKHFRSHKYCPCPQRASEYPSRSLIPCCQTSRTHSVADLFSIPHVGLNFFLRWSVFLILLSFRQKSWPYKGSPVSCSRLEWQYLLKA